MYAEIKEAFARAGILLSDEEKSHGMREFILINDRLSTILTQAEYKITIVKWSRIVLLKRKKGKTLRSCPFSIQSTRV